MIGTQSSKKCSKNTAKQTMDKGKETVTIFGVGRSGTKIAQLYTCLAFLQEHNSCFLAYEPFYWRTRKCDDISPGLKYHEDLPLIANSDSAEAYASPGLNDFLDQVYMAGSGEGPLVIKFIRSNGRISLLEDYLEDTHVVFMLRPLKQVLNSVENQYWDLLGRGLAYRNDWKRFKSELHSLKVERYEDWLDEIDEARRFDRNALFWAVMNHYALTKLRSKKEKFATFTPLDFRDISKNPNEGLRKVSRAIGLKEPNFDFCKISGSDINYDKWIEGVSIDRNDHPGWLKNLSDYMGRPFSPDTLPDSLYSRLKKLRYKTVRGVGGECNYRPEEVSLSEKSCESGHHRIKSSELDDKISARDLYTYLNNEIYETI